jgi:antibiotic biosynthesis monooxygenase (ABM) superfamily enzyme
MYIHMFAFRWKEGVTEAQQQRAMEETSALVGKIPGLLDAFVGKNISPRGSGYEHGGVMRFADRDALEAYGDHPEHQKLVSWLMPLIDPIEVDFQA